MASGRAGVSITVTIPGPTSWQMRELNRVYSKFDKIVELHEGVYTVETVGPEYLCCVGVCALPYLARIAPPASFRDAREKNFLGHGDLALDS